VVWASTIGAAAGPTLLSAGERGAEALGISTHAGGFLITAVFYGAALVCAVALRPEPREIALADTELSERGDATGTLWLPHVRLAVVIMVVGQVTMVLIMTMTPVHVSEHGHGIGAVGFVMSSHLIGMYALAPVVGKVVARVGSVRVAVAGMVVLIVAAVAAGAAPPENAALVAGALFLLGLGWCLGFVAGSALLTRGLEYAGRVQLQGRVDGLVWTSSALASLGSGILLATVGYAALSLIGAAAVVGPLVLVSVRGRAALAE
jgi:MFS family permease